MTVSPGVMRIATLLLIVIATARTAAAQSPQPASTDPVAEAPVRFGPVGLKPRIGVTNLGVDGNVFNELNDQRSDFTFTTSPGSGLWLRTGRGLFSADGQIDLVYFAENDNQRAINYIGSVMYELRFNRFRPFGSFQGRDVKDRPGYEIDSRVRHTDATLTGGIETRLASKSYFQLEYTDTDTAYDESEFVNGQPLSETLDRKLIAIRGTYRHNLTPLTTFIVRGSSEEERFVYATERNSNSGRAELGFQLARFALIRGEAFIGFRSLAAAEGGTIPPFLGLTADTDVSYTAPSQTRLSARVFRDIEYSYDVETPYYVQTGLQLTVTQRVTGRWDVQAVAGRARLTYQGDGAILTNGDQRRDVVNRLGGGIGYQINEEMRIGLDLHNDHRRSPIPNNDYRATRLFGSVTYGY